MQKKEFVIFDFDGTLVNSYQVMAKKFLQLSAQFGIGNFSEDEINALRDLPSKVLIKHLKIPIYKIPAMIYQLRKSMRNEMLTLTPFEGLPEVLQTLSNNHCLLGILTSNSKENVTTWLLRNNLQSLFEFVHNESNFFGKHRVLKKILKQYDIDIQHAFYVGDETRDIDAAQLNSITSIAVTWGFNSERILRDANPDYVATKPEDLLTILNRAE